MTLVYGIGIVEREGEAAKGGMRKPLSRWVHQERRDLNNNKEEEEEENNENNNNKWSS